jgi:ABC-type antimicrobial peptide transport system permease subunit
VQLRARWGSLLVLVLLVGLSGGAVLTTIAAARRTDSAFDRMVRANHTSPALVNPEPGDQSGLTMKTIRSLPAVASARRVDFAMLLPQTFHRLDDFQTTPPLIIPVDDPDLRENRPVIDDGRLPDPSKPDEVFAERWFATQRHLHVGSEIPMKALTGDEVAQIQNFDPNMPNPMQALSHLGTPIRLRVVGIGGSAESVAYDQGFEPQPLLGTAAYWKRYTSAGGPPSAGYWGAFVDLRQGKTADDLRGELQALHLQVAPGVPEAFAVETLASTRTQVERAVNPQVVALWIFAAIAAFVGLFVVGQAVARRLAADGVDNDTLDAMGMTHRERFVSSMLRLSIVGVAGGVTAVLVAFLLSPIAPIGPARLAEVSPGFAADGWVLLLGGLGVAMVTCVLALWPAWRTSRVYRTAEEPRPSGLASWLSGAGSSVASVMGVRFALESGSRSRPIPARSTIVTAATAVAVVVAVVTFAASLDHLVDTPRLYGFPATYSVKTDTGQDERTSAALEAAVSKGLNHAVGVAAWSAVLKSELQLDGHTLPTAAFQGGARPVRPVLRSGRAPTADDEVALGTSTMRSLGLSIGDTVHLGPRGSKGRTAKVVGTVVMPTVGTYEGADKAGLGEGMLVTPKVIRGLNPGFDATGLYAVQTMPGTTSASLRKTLAAVKTPDGTDVVVAGVPEPSDIAALRRLRATPVVLAALLVLLIAATVVHALVLAMRRRRHDVAVLQCVGMRPGQILRSSMWQATTIAVFAVVVGVPIGIVVGRWSWVVLGGVLGVFQEPTVPVAVVVAVAVIVLLAVNAAGLVPGWRSSRRLPGLALRSE